MGIICCHLYTQFFLSYQMSDTEPTTWEWRSTAPGPSVGIVTMVCGGFERHNEN